MSSPAVSPGAINPATAEATSLALPPPGPGILCADPAEGRLPPPPPRGSGPAGPAVGRAR